MNAHLFERRHAFFDFVIYQCQELFKFVAGVHNLNDNRQILLADSIAFGVRRL